VNADDRPRPNVLDLVQELEALTGVQRRRRLDERAAELGLSDEQRRRVEQCLDCEGDVEAGQFLEQPPAPLWDAAGNGESAVSAVGRDDGLAPEGVVPSIPGYEVGRCIGAGGMGSVWRAVQLGTRRPVALKVMNGAFAASERVRARFDREVQITARLQHPNVARVFDSGVHRGAYYYAMELVEPALPLDQYAGQKALSRKQVLELMLLVCRAVAHAHENGVIHRDLKPANILVDDRGQPKVLDFGLAKALAEGGAELTISGEGDLAGTPAYMSPEQAAGGGAPLDTRSDVYTLGVILYRLLTGKSPHELSGSRMELLRRISERDVTVQRAAGLGRELEAVLLKAMSRDRERRYATAAELAADIQCLLKNEPVSARQPTLAYFARKRIRRYWPVASVAAAAAVLVAATMVLAYVRVVAQRAIADRQRDVAERKAMQSQLSLARALTAEADALGAAGRWGKARDSYAQAIRTLAGLGTSPLAPQLGLAEVHRHSPAPVLTLDPGKPVCVAVSDDSRLILTGCADGLAAWEVPLGRRRYSAKPRSAVRDIAVARGGGAVLTTEDQGVEVWDPATGRRLGELVGRDTLAWAAAVSPDGHTAATGDINGMLKIWDLRTLTATAHAKIHDDRIRRLCFSRDGALLVTGSYDRTATVRDARTLAAVAVLGPQPMAVSAVAISPDGSRVLTGSWDTSMRLWDARTGRELRRFDQHEGSVEQIEFAPDGRTFATACTDAVVRLWDASTYELITSFCGHREGVFTVSFSPDGRVLVSGGMDPLVRVWNPHVGAESARLASTSAVTQVALTADARLVLSGHGDGTMRLWDVATRGLLREFPGTDPAPAPRGSGHPKLAVAISSDGRAALSAGGDGEVRLWDLASGRELRRFTGHTGPVRSVAFSSDGRTALTAGDDATARLWEVETGAPVGTIQTSAKCLDSAFLPQSDSVITCDDVGAICVWDRKTGRPRRMVEGNGRYSGVATSLDGRLVLAGGDDSRRLGVWDLESAQAPRELVGHGDHVRSVALSGDGRVAASAAWDRVVKVWDVRTGQEIRSTRTSGTTESIVISADAGVVICGDGAGSTHVWDAPAASARLDFESEMAGTLATLSGNPTDRAARLALARWYAAREMWGWAAEVLEGVEPPAEDSAATLARCYSMLGDTSRAATCFRHAIDGAAEGRDRNYLRLCLASVEGSAGRGQAGGR
jgi:WD40 repeat protein